MTRFRVHFSRQENIMTRFRIRHFVIAFPSRKNYDEISSTFRNRFPVKKKYDEISSTFCNRFPVKKIL